MNADRLASAVAKRHKEGGAGQGLVMVNLQRTTMDAQCRLRLWGLLDDVVSRVVERAVELTQSAHANPLPSLPIAAEAAAGASQADPTRSDVSWPCGRFIMVRPA